MSRRTASLLFFALLTLILAHGQQGWANDQRGQAFFRLCSACHGNQGEGRIDLAAPAIASLPEWYVLTQLRKFRDGARGMHPQDSAGMRMRPMARSVPTEDDLQAVARYVASLAPHASPPTLAGDSARGQDQYLVCMACHGPDGRGNQQLMAPPLVATNDWYLFTQLQNFKHGVRGADPTKDVAGAMMRPMANSLDAQMMQDVIAYIQTLR
jgi:cytochrome c553